jgi:hypothetical protein
MIWLVCRITTGRVIWDEVERFVEFIPGGITSSIEGGLKCFT